jgi:hypothetical protein
MTRSPDHPILSFHNDRPRHIVMSSATNDAALHPELALFRGIENYCNRRSRLDGLINAELLNLEPMLNVLAGDIQNHFLTLLHANHLGFDSEFAHRDREMNGRTGWFLEQELSSSAQKTNKMQSWMRRISNVGIS